MQGLFGLDSEGLEYVMVEKAGWSVSNHSSRSVRPETEKQRAGWHGVQ